MRFTALFPTFLVRIADLVGKLKFFDSLEGGLILASVLKPSVIWPIIT